MKSTLCLLAFGTFLTMSGTPSFGAPFSPGQLALAPASIDIGSHIVPVNIIDRFIQDIGGRKQSSRPSSAKRRETARPATRRGGVPPVPPLTSIPLPIDKPVAEAAPLPETPTAAPKPMEKPEPAEAPAPVETPAETPNATPAETPADTPKATPPVADQAPEKPPEAPAEQPAPGPVAQPATPQDLPPAAEIPKPLPKPEAPETEQPAADPATSAPAAEQPALPKNAETVKEPDETKPGADNKEPETAEAPPPPPVEKEDPAALKACLADITALGTKFSTVDRIDEGSGCGIDQPINVTEPVPGTTIAGGATMRCETALTLARWMKDTVQPALKIAMPERRITGIVPGSTYACRLRNNASTGKISEHARGNALDIAAFKLDNDKTMTMKPRD